jgi:hypothetical protein
MSKRVFDEIFGPMLVCDICKERPGKVEVVVFEEPLFVCLECEATLKNGSNHLREK